MAENVVKFVDTVPTSMTHPPLASSAGHVARKVKREFLPTAQVDYSFDKNDEIEFHLSSSKDFLVPNETYLRVTFATTGTKNGANDINRALEEGGIHNCFRRIEITDTAGRLIDKVEEYDRISNILSYVYQSPDHIRSHELQSGDHSPLVPTGGQFYPLSQQSCSIVAATGVVTGTSTSFASELAQGDVIGLFPPLSDKPILVSVVLTVGSSTSVTLRQSLTADQGGLTIKKYIPPSQLACATQNVNIDSPSDTTDLNIRLNVGLFNVNEDLPLFLMDGLVVKLYLREPRFVMNSDSQAIGNLPSPFTLDYKISKPRMIATLRTPSDDVRAQYMSLFQQGNLNYVFPAFHHIARQESGSQSSSIELDLPIAKSSVRRVLMTCQNELARGNLNENDRKQNTYTYPSKTFIDGRIVDYQFKVGGVDYPQLRVDCSDVFMTEAYNELLRTFEIHNNVNSMPRLSWDKWMKIHASSSENNSEPVPENFYLESKKAIFSTSFTTVMGDPMAGLKTKGIGTDNHIICNLNVAGPNLVNQLASTRYFDFYFEYSKILHLSQTGILVLD